MHANTALAAKPDPGRVPFSISTATQGNVTILSVCGEIDLLTIDRLRQAIEDTFRAGTSDLLVDLTRTTFLASAGLTALERARERAETSGGKFAVVTAQSATSRPIIALHLEKELGLRNSVDEVIEKWIRPDVRWPEPSPLDSWWIDVMSPEPKNGESDHLTRRLKT